MSDGMGREFAYLSSHAPNRYFIPNWGMNALFVDGNKKIMSKLLVKTNMEVLFWKK